MIEVTCDRARLDVELIHRYLCNESYWAAGIPREVVERAIAHSLCFGAFDGQAQVGFARVVTDYATFGYLADVFVLESHRGRGVGQQLLHTIRAHPALQGFRRWHLLTRDAHGLYRKFGFGELESPPRHMELTVKNAYA